MCGNNECWFCFTHWQTLIFYFDPNITSINTHDYIKYPQKPLEIFQITGFRSKKQQSLRYVFQVLLNVKDTPK